MSMIGEYARVSPAELQRVIRDPEWALGFVNDLVEAELDGGDPDVKTGEARCLDTDKAWDALGFLLRRTGLPVDVVHGEDEIPGADDWGYGPPRYLTPERVKVAAAGLIRISGSELVAGVDPAELAAADTYPVIVWERGESLDWVREHYEALVPFFEAAARAGDGMLIWLD
ncbi:YfbM family protein [Streptomyces sp. SCSIO 30461]|uniref:YfbM family protein n=1 Tax=Streptomyces sp. SCSIO 30461 TaxID=3118085 RepID=UPI0030D04839